MSTILDQFILVFGEQGAKQLEKTIDNIGKTVVDATNKAIKAQNKAEKARSSSLKNLSEANKKRHKLSVESSRIEEKNLRKILPLEVQLERSLKNKEKLEKSISTISKNTIKYQEQRNKLAKENTRILELQGKIKRKQDLEELDRASKRNKTIALTIASVSLLGRTVLRANDWAKNARRSGVGLATSYLGTGLTSANAQGIDQYLGRFGGSVGEGVSALSSINAKIGAMKYGDTSLIETLGTFGISGIGATSTSKDVLKAVISRAKTMDTASQEALFDALGFTPAMKAMARKGDIEGLNATADPLEYDKKTVDLLEKTYKADFEVLKATQSVAEDLEPITKTINMLKEKFPKVFAYYDALDWGTFVKGAIGFFGAKSVDKLLDKFAKPQPTGTPTPTTTRTQTGTPAPTTTGTPTRMPKTDIPKGTKVEGKTFDGKNWRDANNRFTKAPSQEAISRELSKPSRIAGGGLLASVSRLATRGFGLGLFLTPNTLGGGEDEKLREMQSQKQAQMFKQILIEKYNDFYNKKAYLDRELIEKTISKNYITDSHNSSSVYNYYYGAGSFEPPFPMVDVNYVGR